MTPARAGIALLAGSLLAPLPGRPCDITRWPSTARLRTALEAPPRTAVAVRYSLPAAPAARDLAALRLVLPAALDDDAAEAAADGATLSVRGDRLPASWHGLDALVSFRFPGARRTECRVEITLGHGPVPAAAQKAIRGLPEVAGADVAFTGGSVLLRYARDASPPPQLPRRVRQAVAS